MSYSDDLQAAISSVFPDLPPTTYHPSKLPWSGLDSAHTRFQAENPDYPKDSELTYQTSRFILPPPADWNGVADTVKTWLAKNKSGHIYFRWNEEAQQIYGAASWAYYVTKADLNVPDSYGWDRGLVSSGYERSTWEIRNDYHWFDIDHHETPVWHNFFTWLDVWLEDETWKYKLTTQIAFAGQWPPNVAGTRILSDDLSLEPSPSGGVNERVQYIYTYNRYTTDHQQALLDYDTHRQADGIDQAGITGAATIADPWLVYVGISPEY